MAHRHIRLGLSSVALAAGTGAVAQTQDDEAAEEASAVTPGARVFVPAYFEQYAPRNALDMVRRIPGFLIQGQNDDERGLGQASENVIVNGERLSSKSDSARDQLSRIPAGDVVRIEIVEGTSLDIPGLSGQVANIIVESSGAAGQFRWRTGFRAHNTEAQLYSGEVSLTGSSGDLDYTVSLSNDDNRFGADGPTLITDSSGAPIEVQETKLSGKFDNPTLSSNFTYAFAPEVVGNLNLKYGEDFFSRIDPETGTSPAGLIRVRDGSRKEDGPEYEIGADIEFPLGPGKLKLIGLERFERDNSVSQVVDRFSDGRDPEGFRFEQTNSEGERIGRFEYGWTMWKADWQLSGEAAFNRLDRVSRLFALQPDETFDRLDFPAGTGGVTEDRYEAILSFSKQLAPKLALQATGGAENSTIEQTGSAANSRSFLRPKGSVSLAWKPEDDFDISVELRRRVGQLDFGDFLASVSLNNDNQNGGNNELVPDQSWNIDTEINKGLGAWGSLKFEVRQAWFEDFVDFFPLPDGGEARGNIGDARRTHLELSGTLKFDPIGWTGAELTFGGIRRWMSVTDPFTGEDRPFSFDLIDQLEADLRHDIPGSNWAWGGGIFTFNPAGYSRRQEAGRDWEGPVFLDIFVEHKDVFGMTANARVGNVLGARNKFFRTVFDGDRPDGPILFVEDTNRRIGPIFRFTLSGNF